LGSKINKYTDGCDHRYLTANESFSINNNTVAPFAYQSEATVEDIYKFNGYFYKLKLLKKLTSPEISEQEKISAIDTYEGYNNSSKYTIDLKAGGLYKDWDITII